MPVPQRDPAARFAASVRARTTPRGARRSRAARGPSSVDRVLVQPLRPLVRHDHHHRHDDRHLHLAVRLAIGVAATGGAGAPRPGAVRQPLVLATATPRTTDAAPRAASAAPAPALPMTVVQRLVVLRTQEAFEARRAGAPARARDEASRSAPTPVVLVQRALATPAAAAPAPAVAPAERTLFGPGAAPVLTATAEPDRAALTTADLPVVVGRVMDELDRRFVAARERRGWTP